MKTAIAIVVALALAGASFAEDKPVPDPELAARVAAAQAKLKAKTAAATQAVASDDPAVLKAIILGQKHQIESLRAHVAKLTQEVAAAKNNGQPGATPEIGQKKPTVEKDAIVLSHREFAALPRDERGEPLDFTDVKMNSVGWIHTALILQIVDEKTAVVSISLDNNGYGQRGRVSGADINASLVIQGQPTEGKADNTGWALQGWFKVVGTMKQGGTTYVVAQPIVEAGKTQKPAK